MESPICGPYPIHGPARLAFKWKEKCEKKMWVDFRVLENPSQRSNGFTLESPLTFICILNGENQVRKKNPNDSSMEKKRSAKTRFLGPGIKLPIGKVPHMR